MNILIIKTSAIGDVVHTLPVLTTLRRRYPDARIDWLVEEAAADLVEGHAAVDRVLVARRRTWTRQLRSGRVLAATGAARRFARDLRRTRYDLLLDLTGLLKSSVWVVLARARRKVGFDRGMAHAEGSWLFLNERVAPVDMEVHALSRGLILLERIGIDAGGPVAFDVPVTGEDRARARDLLGDDADHERLVAISPVATWPTKLWDGRRFAEVADALAERGCRVIVTGGPDDAAAVEAICAAAGSAPRRLDGRTSLRELAAVFAHCRLVLATDSGPMHLAAAMGVPVVAIFGPTAPWRTGPWGAEHTILRAGVGCSPCFKRECLTEEYEKMACMGRIDVERVVEAVLRRLET